MKYRTISHYCFVKLGGTKIFEVGDIEGTKGNCCYWTFSWGKL